MRPLEGPGLPTRYLLTRDLSSKVRRGWAGPVILEHTVVPESQCARRSIGAGWAAGPAICDKLNGNPFISLHKTLLIFVPVIP